MQLMHLSGGEVGWADLCCPLPFWDLYSEFLELRISGRTVESFCRFKGLVESRIRGLIRCIEQLEKRITVRPHPDLFIDESANNKGSFFIGIAAESSVDLKPAIDQFIADTLEKGLQAPEWADVRSEVRLEFLVTTGSQDPDERSGKRQRVSDEMDD